MHPPGRETFGVILAGGRGTRLGALTRKRCKPALHFGGACRSIDFTLSNCGNSGLQRVAIAAQYRSQSLVRHLQRNWSSTPLGPHMEVWSAEQQRSHYRGTADAVYQNLPRLGRHRPRHVLILAADHVYRMHYGSLVECHRQTGADVTVACQPVPVEQARQYGIVTVRSDRIVSFVEKPQHLDASTDPLASMGIYVFNAEFLCELLHADARRPESARDFGRDILPACLHTAGVRVSAHEFRDPCTGGPGYWRDIGTIDAYWSANMEQLQPGTALDPCDPRWPVWGVPERAAPVRVAAAADGRATVVSGSLVANGCVLDGAVVNRSILSENVHLGRGSMIEDSVLLPGARIGRDCCLRRVIVDEGVVVPHGSCLADGGMPADGLFETTDGGITVLYGFRGRTRQRRRPPAPAGANGLSAARTRPAVEPGPPASSVGGIA